MFCFGSSYKRCFNLNSHQEVLILLLLIVIHSRRWILKFPCIWACITPRLPSLYPCPVFSILSRFPPCGCVDCNEFLKLLCARFPVETEMNTVHKERVEEGKLLAGRFSSTQHRCNRFVLFLQTLACCNNGNGLNYWRKHVICKYVAFIS